MCFLKMGMRIRNVCKMRQAMAGDKIKMFGIAKTGPRPMGGYGSQVLGLSDSELKCFRKQLMATMTPATRGSLTGKLCMAGDQLLLRQQGQPRPGPVKYGGWPEVT